MLKQNQVFSLICRRKHLLTWYFEKKKTQETWHFWRNVLKKSWCFCRDFLKRKIIFSVRMRMQLTLLSTGKSPCQKHKDCFHERNFLLIRMFLKESCRTYYKKLSLSKYQILSLCQITLQRCKELPLSHV